MIRKFVERGLDMVARLCARMSAEEGIDGYIRAATKVERRKCLADVDKVIESLPAGSPEAVALGAAKKKIEQRDQTTAETAPGLW